MKKTDRIRRGKLQLSLIAFTGAGSLVGLTANAVGDGPFSSHDEGGISADSIAAWAGEVIDYSPSPQNNTNANFTNAIGPRDGSTVSLGDLSEEEIAAGVAPGEITVRFDSPIFNGDGDDFAVFDNGFEFGDGLFAELAYVDISTDGRHFARFPSISLNEGPLPGGFGSAFSSYDMTYVDNLAGSKAQPFGTGFNLQDVAGDPLVLGGLVDLNEVNYVRLVDIPGNGSFLDSEGNSIVDNWLTTGSGGFDLDAVGGMNVIPEPGTVALLAGTIALGVAGLRRRKAE